MLKIKDDVPLEELKKFGFEKFEQYEKHYTAEASKKDIDLYYSQYRGFGMGVYFRAGVHIIIDNREVFVWIDIYSSDEIETDFKSIDIEYYIQDLIKSGIVEKVEE